MPYWKHFSLNMGVAVRCLLMAAFHAAHALLPVELTSHEYWGFRFNKGG
jgi:hypothetical protein